MAKILVTDDEFVLRMLIRDTLEDEGHEVVEAADGGEAMAKLKQQEFDLLVLDYMMPHMTGIEVMEELARAGMLERLKVLMLTAKTQQDDQAMMIASGVNGWMSKPFSPADLAKRVGELTS